MLRLLGIFLLALGLIGCNAQSTSSSKSPKTAAQFVFVKIPENIGPVERGSKYEDPLDAALKKAGVGMVSGGGTQMGAPDAAGKSSIEWVGVDVEISDFARGMPVLKSELIKLGAPSSTVLSFTRNGEKFDEKLR